MLSRKNMAQLLCLSSLAITLAGCATPSSVPTDRPGIISIPPSLLRCKAEPVVPDPATATDVDVARWEVDLMAAGCDCRDKLAAVKALQEGKTAPPSTCTVR